MDPYRLLIVSPCPTHPTNAGNRARINGLASALREEGVEVHVAYLPTALFHAGDLDAMKEHWGDALHVLHPFTTWDLGTRVRRKLGAVAETLLAFLLPKARARSEIPTVDSHYLSWWNLQLRMLHRKFRYRTVVVEYIFATTALPVFDDRVTKVVDTHDRFSERNERMRKAGLTAGEWLSVDEESEGRALDRADVVVAIQETEARELRSLTRKPVVTVGHIGLPSRVPGAGEAPGCPTLLIVASDNAPNADGCAWFIEEVLPPILRASPNAVTRIVGSVERRLRAAYGAREGLRLVGVVDDLAREYAEATVVVNPVRFGTGLAVKAVEALAYGKPLVGTPAGLRGLPRIPGQPLPYVAAETASELGSAILALLADPERRSALAEGGVEYIRAQEKLHRRRLLDVCRGNVQKGG